MEEAPHYYDPQRVLVEDWRSFCVNNRDRKFILPCIEGDVEMTGARLLLNLMITMPLIKRHRPISRDNHLLLSGIYNSSEHANCLTRISRSLEDVGYTRDELGHDIISTAMDSHNMCYTHLGSDVIGIDIFSIADTVLQEEAIDACTMDYGNIEDGNIKRMQDDFKVKSQEMIDLLSGDTLPINVFRAPLVCGALKPGQFAQHVLSIGPRTDTDEHVFLRPVQGSFLSGMKNVAELAMESRSASKSTHYNSTQMQQTQYMNRMIHTQNSVIRHLYPGDCGSTAYLTFHISRRTAKFFIGIFYLTEGGIWTEITEDKFDDIIDKTIQMRTVLGCRYTDGYCQTCGGTITKSFSPSGNVGFLANVNVGAPVAQQVLSAKHLTSTDAAEYEIPDVLSDTLFSDANNIYLQRRRHKRINVLAFGFQHSDISKINDLKYYVSENELHAAYFTDIKYLHIGLLKEDGSVERHLARTPMGGSTKTYPHLSPEILAVIRENPEDIIIQDGISWFLLRNIDPDKPIMQCTVVNNSIKRFVQRFRDMVTSDVERYTSMNDFMRDLTRLIWPRVNSHITHVACLARACMVTNKRDFSIPIVEDPDKVTFGSLSKIIPMRSVGGLLAFERYNIATNKPSTYITPKRHGIFDEFMGYQDIIERDQNWPEGTGENT
mgnify:CR=1 FL=1